MINLSTETVIPLLLYAETHFRFFKGFPSFLFKNEPEIIFDCPRRTDPGKELPIILIINDLHNSSTTLNKVDIAISIPGSAIKLFSFSEFKNLEIAHEFSNTQKVYLFIIKDQLPNNEQIYINCKANLTIKGKERDVLNDNLQTSSKAPFSCFISKDNLPGNRYCLQGDLHFHSQYSQSHVEFGPPLLAVDKLADSSGLDFLAITDHSYDLACKMDNYLLEDQDTPRWKSLQNQLNISNTSTLFIPGEEVSCLNESGNIVHLCGIGLSRYIPGSMDGARKKKIFKTQFNIDQTIKEIDAQNGLAFAAHPGSKKSLLQSVFLNRGSWSPNDISKNKLGGIQAFNGSFKAVWDRGKQLWLNALMRGMKLPIIAGNDAHGDFNRYRAIKIPFLSIFENFDRYMGFGKTGVYCNEKTTLAILNAVKDGKTFITTGPFLSICYSSVPSDCAISNSLICKEIKELFIHAISTPEFGSLTKLLIYGYFQSEKCETLLFSKNYAKDQLIECIPFPVNLETYPTIVYLRAEVISKKNDSHSCSAITSPCYFR